MGEFELPKTIEDVVKLRNVMKHLWKLKMIIEENAKKIELAIRKMKDSLQESERSTMESEDIPRPSWLRGSPGEERRVKKTKKKNDK